ncbi:MAG: TIGR03084 family protein [Alphaproteobacteria bacterium]|nr:TIGR03084 family protein [Alphaproteobacteria bacterium]
MQQATDFRDESRALAAILEPLSDKEFAAVTQFKGWSINDVIGHLHMFNVAADLTLKDGDLFVAFFGRIAKGMAAGQSLLETQYPFLDGLTGRALFETWRDGAEQTAENYAKADPKLRLKWAGPEMSARSAITARQMETWAHGQEVFDLLGVVRKDTDRIKNVVHLGVSTFGWSFINRAQKVPEPAPFIELTAPSGVVWTWNEPQSDNAVHGQAVEFAQVVTQVRAIADTSLRLTGNTAKSWMEIAQCFAGPPETPPAKGVRFTMV